MKKILIFLSLIFTTLYCNDNLNYENRKLELIKKYEKEKPKEWSEAATGVKTKLDTKEKVIALTMDACGGTNGSDFDKDLIEFLEKKQIPATLFINARWIEKNKQTFKTLASNPLFEIANHGFLHKPASVNGNSIYKIKGTKNIDELVDEIELNARYIESLTNKRPKYFRSGTAYYDEIAVKIANDLNHEVVGFSILGDSGATYNEKQIQNAFLKAKNGDISIIHFNHPKSDTKNGLIKVVEKLRKDGFKFVKLSDYSLK